MTDYDIVQAMLTYGGSFVQALAKAWLAGDSINQEKLKTAFPEYWKEYDDLAYAKAGGVVR